MGRPANAIPRVVVEGCETIKVTDTLRCLTPGLLETGRATPVNIARLWRVSLSHCDDTLKVVVACHLER